MIDGQRRGYIVFWVDIGRHVTFERGAVCRWLHVFGQWRADENDARFTPVAQIDGGADAAVEMTAHDPDRHLDEQGGGASVAEASVGVDELGRLAGVELGTTQCLVFAQDTIEGDGLLGVAASGDDEARRGLQVASAVLRASRPARPAGAPRGAPAACRAHRSSSQKWGDGERRGWAGCRIFSAGPWSRGPETTVSASSPAADGGRGSRDGAARWKKCLG